MAAFLSEIERIAALFGYTSFVVSLLSLLVSRPTVVRVLRPAGKFSRVVRPVREKPRLRDRVSTLFLKWLENRAETNSLAIRLACRIA